jgi:hypothetical protein
VRGSLQAVLSTEVRPRQRGMATADAAREEGQTVDDCGRPGDGRTGKRPDVPSLEQLHRDVAPVERRVGGEVRHVAGVVDELDEARVLQSNGIAFSDDLRFAAPLPRS